MAWRRRLGAGAGTLDGWVAWLFMAGSALFALGSFPPYSQRVDGRAVGITFVAGSVLFTSAAAGALAQALRDHVDGRLVWACGVQLVGTVLFNVNTVRALRDTFDDAHEANRLVWAPDAFGSIAFLVASHLAWIVVCHGLWRVARDDADWWVAGLNYVGSILFMVSALASFTLETTGEEINQTLVNSATFGGAVCFLVGAYLLLPPDPGCADDPAQGLDDLVA
jgi:hypothetical protein